MAPKQMMENNFESVVTYVLFIWSAVLVWGSWRVYVMSCRVILERRELRRWARVSALRERERERWEK